MLPRHRRYIKEALPLVVKHSFILQMEDFSQEYLIRKRSYVLQCTYGGTSLRKSLLQEYAKQVKLVEHIFSSTKVAIERKRELLVQLVEYLQAKFPSEFKEHGWYDVQVAVLKVVETKKIVKSRRE